MWVKHGETNQKWDIIYADDMPQEEPKKGELNQEFGFYVARPFHVISQMPGRRYLDIDGGRNIVIRRESKKDTQVWYFDQKSKTIKSQKNNESFDIQNAGKSNNMQIWRTNGNWFQQFRLIGMTIMNVKNGKVLDVAANRDADGQNVLAYARHDGLNQRWKIVYLDEIKPEPASGLDKEAGLYRNRPFLITSKMGGKRVVTIKGNDLIMQSKDDNNEGQLWYYDHLTRTIKSQQFKGKSIDISNAGKGQNLIVWKTSGKWW